jgi:rSAM/selenodomain-associated transferase 1
MSTPAIPTPVRIIVMAKAPRAGQAKTRLIPALGAEGAAALARRLLHHTLGEALAAAESLKHEQIDSAVILCGTPLSPLPAQNEALWDLPELNDWLPRLHLQDQGDGDLGARMSRAVHGPLMAGQPCVLIGTDCPALGREALHGIVLDLQQHDVVMVPAADGGYVALGLRRFEPTLFTDMPWSTPEVARLTRQRLAAAGLSLHEWPPEHDIDEPADLAHLPNLLHRPQGGPISG